jgi:hypothetical protein
MTVPEPQAGDTRATFLTRVVEWLRAGYPTGVPRQDYVVLLGLLRRKLTDEEVRAIAGALVEGGRPEEDPISRIEIEDLIRASMLQSAREEDVVRVSAHLATGGWPLADPPLD